jgi:hypothetical protein
METSRKRERLYTAREGERDIEILRFEIGEIALIFKFEKFADFLLFPFEINK